MVIQKKRKKNLWGSLHQKLVAPAATWGTFEDGPVGRGDYVFWFQLENENEEERGTVSS